MYLLQAKEKVDKEVRKKERERKKRLRQERKERKKIDSYDGLVQGWQDTTFNCGYLGSFAVSCVATFTSRTPHSHTLNAHTRAYQRLPFHAGPSHLRDASPWPQTRVH